MPNQYLLIRKLFFYQFVLLIACGLFSNSVLANKYASVSKQLRAEFRAQAERAEVPGISVAVGIGDQIVWAEGFGLADLEQDVAVNAQTKFRIGSISKVMATAALMRLREQGLIDIDAPVQNYVTDYPTAAAPINLRLLTGHRSGIRHYQGEEFLSNQWYPDSYSALTIFKHDPLLFKPGSAMAYSTYGWTVVSAVMEAASKKHFLTLLQEQVFEPLKLQNTAPDHNARLIPNRAAYYQLSPSGQLENTPQVDASYKWAGGGILSTPSDVALFALAHTDSGYLSKQSLHDIFYAHNFDTGQANDFGIGWMLHSESMQQKFTKTLASPDQKALYRLAAIGDVVSHSGGSMGGTSQLLLNRQAKIAVVVTSNRSDASDYVFALAAKTLSAFCLKTKDCVTKTP